MAPHQQPRRWFEFALEPYPTGDSATYRWAPRPMAGSIFIEGRVETENIVRAASSMSGSPHIDSASVRLFDTDGTIRSLLSQPSTQWFIHREATYKLLSEAGFIAGLDPRIRFGGRCYNAQLEDARRARLEIEDPFAPFMDREYPQYTIGDLYPWRFQNPPEVVDHLNSIDPGLQIPIALRDRVAPIYYGYFIDTAVDAVTGQLRMKGLIPTFFMGYTHLTAGTGTVGEPTPELAALMEPFYTSAEWGGWGELLVAVGDEYSFPNVYVSDLSENPKRILLGDDRYGVDVIAPGHPGWPFDTDYVIRNGFKCWVIYARGPVLWHHIVGLCNITVDLCTPIDQAAFVWQDFLSEHVLAHGGRGYTSGPKAGLPTYSDGRAMFWTSRIQEWQTMTKARLGTAKGYLCSMALTEKTTLRAIEQRFAETFDWFTASNAAGQRYVFGIDDLADPTSGVPIREIIELTSLPAPRLAWDEMENEIQYTVGYDPEQNTARTPVITIKNEDSFNALAGSGTPSGSGRRFKQQRDLRYTADDATANDVMGRRLLRLSIGPPVYQPLPVRVGGVDREIGEQIRVTHRDGLGPEGYQLQPMVIMEHRSQDDAITLAALDVSRIVATGLNSPLEGGGQGWGWYTWPID